jgi:hypothetical protein
MTSTPTQERVRLTITVTPEVHAAFDRLAKASGFSLGRAMGEWLGDTLEAVEYTAAKVEEARLAPKLVMREIHAMAMGLADETSAALAGMKAGSKLATARRGAPLPSEPATPIPPRPVIRGGKYPGKGKGKKS